MRHALLLAALSLPACHRDTRRVRSTPGHAQSAQPQPVATRPASLAEVRARSGCAFASREALCASFIELYRSSGEGWVSDRCAFGTPRTSSGPFAEALLVGVRLGYNRPSSTSTVERPLLGGTVRVPVSDEEGTSKIVLVARVGSAWFPIRIFDADGHRDVSGESIEWSIEESGAYITWANHEGTTAPDDPDGYGRRERSIAVVDRGVPMLAASATVADWRSEVDLPCARACNGAPNPPPSPECSRRCASSLRQSRSWQRTGSTLRVGETVVERNGPRAASLEEHREPAFIRRLDVMDGWLEFCAFMPVVHAVEHPVLATDDASVAARTRGLAALRSGRFRDVPGAAAAVAPGAARSQLEIYGTSGTACGGGGCTTGVAFRTLRGTMPETGVDYFANERGNQVGCDSAALPRGPGSTYVEVALATSREAIGCGFSGFDGTTRRYWIITRVLVPRP